MRSSSATRSRPTSWRSTCVHEPLPAVGVDAAVRADHLDRVAVHPDDRRVGHDVEHRREVEEELRRLGDPWPVERGARRPLVEPDQVEHELVRAPLIPRRKELDVRSAAGSSAPRAATRSCAGGGTPLPRARRSTSGAPPVRPSAASSRPPRSSRRGAGRPPARTAHSARVGTPATSGGSRHRDRTRAGGAAPWSPSVRTPTPRTAPTPGAPRGPGARAAALPPAAARA